MISIFFREQNRYTQEELFDRLKCSEEEGVSYIRKLKEFGVLKAVKASNSQRDMSDLAEEDIEVADVDIYENDYYYVFTFVGVIVVAGVVLKCYPKYLLSVEEPNVELHQVLRVIEKYNAKEQIIRMFNDSNEGHAFNLLAVLLFLIHDYYDNGIYNNTEVIIETNGPGEILWEKTINETFTIISENRPFYPDLQTRKRVTDDFDYFQRLHECILTKASKELKDAQLLDLFDITEVDLTDERLDEFGDNEYILYRIKRELNVQFNTRKQLVLKTIASYIEQSESLHDIDCLSLFGTNSFNLVWEGVCAEILDNKLEKTIGELESLLPTSLKSSYERESKLGKLIKAPLWTITGKRATKTLEPDIISISGDKFVIFDAKYYNPLLEKDSTPARQPGVESVTKQYLYELAYKKFVEDHGFTSVNCFLIPTEGNDVVAKGGVKMEILSELGLKDIKVRLFPARKAYDYYLKGEKISDDEFGDIIKD